MIQKEFFPNKTALTTLIAACLVVIISLGIRQTFGLFFFDFEIDLGCTQTEFGFAMGIQLLFWGLLGPVFGIVTDKYGGRIAVIIPKRGPSSPQKSNCIPMANPNSG